MIYEPSLLLCLSFSTFISSSKYSFYFSPNSSLISTFPSLSLITLTHSTSFPARSLCPANQYNSFSRSLVVSHTAQYKPYFCLYHFCLSHVLYTFAFLGSFGSGGRTGSLANGRSVDWSPAPQLISGQDTEPQITPRPITVCVCVQ